MPELPIPDGTYGGATFTNCTVTLTDEELAQLRARRRRRLDAIGFIVSMSELVGARGLHLTWDEVDGMPEGARRALRALGVSDEEIEAEAAEAVAEEEERSR